MTVPTDLQRCSGWFVCESSGYDSGNSRLIDQTGLGLHMPLASGSAPAFIARGGVNCVDLTNTFFFELPNPILVQGSIVFKFHTDASGAATGTLAIMGWASPGYATGDHVASTPLGPWESYDLRQLYWMATSALHRLRATNLSGSDPLVETAALALNTWHVATVVWNHRDLAAKLQLGAGAIITDTQTPEPLQAPAQAESRMRLGYLKVSGGLTAPQHFSIAQMAFFEDDILLNQPTEAAALVASWS
jgi:hypothetical protein